MDPSATLDYFGYVIAAYSIGTHLNYFPSLKKFFLKVETLKTLNYYFIPSLKSRNVKLKTI